MCRYSLLCASKPRVRETAAVPERSKNMKKTLRRMCGREKKSMQEMVANEVNDRMGRAVGELKDKYEKGGKGYDAASDAQVKDKKKITKQ